MSKLDPSDISTLPWYNDEFGKYFIFIFLKNIPFTP